MSKKVPNPNGKKGNIDHQNLIEKILLLLQELFPNADKEGRINLENGKKRFADVVGRDENNVIKEIHQVGRTNKDGSPVKREKLAIKDIEKTTGLKVIFHALLVLIFVSISCFLTYKYFTKLSKSNKNTVEMIQTK